MERPNDIWIVFDVDGVITDGTIITDGVRAAQKRINLKDVDTIYELSKMGCKIAAITAERDSFSSWIQQRFPWDEFYDSASEKGALLSQLREKYQISDGNLYYVGDGKKDLQALKDADIAICPSDAIDSVRDQSDVLLRGSAGEGALWEIVQIINRRLNRRERLAEHEHLVFRETWEASLNTHRQVLGFMGSEEMEAVVCSSAERICNAIKSGHKLLLFGNGGSASDAQHIAAEFVGKYLARKDALCAIALTENTSAITSIANDYGFDLVFSRQVKALATSGDVVVGISTSGCSENVLKGLEAAKNIGAYTIMLTGANLCSAAADTLIQVPSTYTPCIQEMHIIIGHFWAACAERE